MQNVKITPPTPAQKRDTSDMLLTRGNAAIAMLETAVTAMKMVTKAVEQSLKEMQDFDKKFNVPVDPENQQAAVIRTVRSANPAFANLTDAQILEELKRGQVQN